MGDDELALRRIGREVMRVDQRETAEEAAHRHGGDRRKQRVGPGVEQLAGALPRRAE